MHQEYTMEYEAMNATKTWLNGLGYLNETWPLEWGLWMNDEQWTNDYKAWPLGLECITGLWSIGYEWQYRIHMTWMKALNQKKPQSCRHVGQMINLRNDS